MKKEKEIKSIMTTLKANTDEMAKLAQSDINGVYSPFSPCDHIPPSMDPCAFESLLSPIRFVFSRYLFVSTAWVFAILQLISQWTPGVSSQVRKHRLSCLSLLDNFTSCSAWTAFRFALIVWYRTHPGLLFFFNNIEHTSGCAGSETKGGGMHVVSLQSAKKKKEAARFCYRRGFIRMKWVSAAPIWPGCVLASRLPVTTLEYS